MILVGSQRGGASQLAAHLGNDRDNDHVSVAELRGFVAPDLDGALNEAHAISKGTRCKQFLFSLSLNPPRDAAAGIDALIEAANRAESALGLEGQPRAIVIHEKEGRRHAHVVWSRIDAERMTAINLPHFKSRLCALSKELYLEHGWDLPDGHKQNGWKSPLNFTLAEWQQAKRLDLDPREIKQIFQTALRQSDNLASFRNALEEHGYFLAKGDRRAIVALDIHGEVYAAARWAGIKTKDMNQRLGTPDALPGLDEARTTLRTRLTNSLRSHLGDNRNAQQSERQPLFRERTAMVAAHRAEREQLAKKQDERLRAEMRERAKRLHTGIRGMWEWMTGKARAIRRQNEFEAYQGSLRDRAQRERLFDAQMRERRALQERIDALRAQHREHRMSLARRIIAAVRRADGAVPEQSRTMRPRMRRGM